MRNKKSRALVISGLLVAVGLILPWVTAHAFGVPGTVLLPMHIPVLLSGMMCGPYFGVLTGLAAPILSSLLTGMPAFYPMLPIMLAQLSVMGLVSGLARHRLKLPVYPCLLLSMISGWALYGLAYAVLMLAGDGSLKALSVTAALLRGIPGMIAQLTLIPLLLTALRRDQDGARQADTPPKDPLAEALERIKGGGVSCVVIREDRVIHAVDGRGVSPLLSLYREEPGKLENAFVVDKIIGKAAAMLLVLGGAKRAYGLIMSAAGREYLRNNGVTAEYGRCVDVISNREGSGICPIEKSVLDTDDPREGLARMTATLQTLTKHAG